MKKIVALILMLLMACSTALAETDYASMETNELYQIYEDVLAEILRRSQPVDRPEATTDEPITFRGIPWGSTPAAFTDAMAALKITPSYRNNDMPSFEREARSGSLNATYTLDDAGFNCVPGPKDLTIAGFPVSYVGAYFHYGFDNENVYEDQEHAQLYMAYYVFKPVDYATAYDTLAVKLMQLYGQGEVHEDSYRWHHMNTDEYSTEYTNWIVWTGADDTAALLWHNYDLYESGAVEDSKLYLYYGRNNSVEMLKALEAAMAREELEQAAGDISGL